MIFSKLSEFGVVVMGMSPSGETYNEKGEGLPLLNGPTEFTNTCPIPKLFTTDSKRECKDGDLIFCVRGSTTGKMNWSDQIYSIGRGVCAIRGNNNIDTKYIRYCIEHNLQGLLAVAGGGTFPNLKKDDIGNFQISIINNRKKIVEILSSYDDLIENNLKRIKLLEETAQNIYKEWFVNFRFPNYENTPFNEETGLPVGWKKGKVSDLCEVKSGYAFKSKDWKTEGNPVIKIKNITNNTVDINDCDYVDDEVAKNAEKFELFEGDVLIAMTGATVGKVGLIPKIDKRIYINQRVGLFRPFSELQNNVYLIFAFFMTDDALKQILNFAGGAAQPNISSTQIAEIELNIGSEKIQKIFQYKINPIMQQIQILYNQNQKLKESRDILLPRLMNRTIEV